MLIQYRTLAEACARARMRPPNTVALVLSLEGNRYYLFLSQPNLGQLMNRIATNYINVALEVEQYSTLSVSGAWPDDSLKLDFALRFTDKPSVTVQGRTDENGLALIRGRLEHLEIKIPLNLPFWSRCAMNQNYMIPGGRYTYNFSVTPLTPSGIRNAIGLPQKENPRIHDLRRGRAHHLGQIFHEEAIHQGIEQRPGHAEIFMIEEWEACMRAFKKDHGRLPGSIDLFLTHSPCLEEDRNPSPEVHLAGIRYPATCSKKLQVFFKRNKAVRWTVFYWQRFGVAEQMTEELLAARFESLGIRLKRMDDTCGRMLAG